MPSRKANGTVIEFTFLENNSGDDSDNKDYYDDRDIKPEENIFIKLTIMPFGQIASTPDLKD